MSGLVAKRVQWNAAGTEFAFRWWCPGCDSNHVVPTDGPNAWSFDENWEAPTLSPSVLVHSHKTLIDNMLEGDALTAPSNITATPQCHCFIRAGRIEYLADSTHGLAGQTVDMVAIL